MEIDNLELLHELQIEVQCEYLCIFDCYMRQLTPPPQPPPPNTHNVSLVNFIHGILIYYGIIFFCFSYLEYMKYGIQIVNISMHVYLSLFVITAFIMDFNKRSMVKYVLSGHGLVLCSKWSYCD